MKERIIQTHEPVSKTLAKQNQDTRQLNKAQKIDTIGGCKNPHKKISNRVKMQQSVPL
jgi:hypothetical protein